MIAEDYPFERKANKLLSVAASVAAALLSAHVCLAADSVRVTAVRFWSLGDVTRVAIEVSSEFHYKSDRLPSPERLFFDIHGATPGMVRKGVHTIDVGDGLIAQIRVAEVTPGVTRVVMDLTQPATAVTSQLSNPDRLLVEVRYKDKPVPPPSSGVSGASKLNSLPAPVAEAPRTATVKAAPSAPKLTTQADSSVSAAPNQQAASAQVAVSSAATPLAPAAAASVPSPAPTGIASSATRPEKRAAAEQDSRNGKRAAARKAVGTLPADPAPPASGRARAEAPAADGASNNVSTGSLDSSSTANATNRETVGPGASNAPTFVSNTDPETGAAPRDATARDLMAKTIAPREMGPAPLPAKRGNRTLTRALGLKLGRVVLDAGHGGHDVGTHGPSGYLEKDLTLDVAQRLGSLIEEGLGSEVIYTRPSDTYIGLEERTRIANERKADLFLSIHANSSTYRSAAGAETYVLSFTTSKNALDLAARENASSQSSIFDLQELLNKIALKEKIDESSEFAARLQTALSVLSAKSNEAAKNRGVKRAPFVVLIGANMPSVLAEIGFLTNSNDEALLRKPEHRQKIAEALYKGIASYAGTLSHFQVAQN